MLCFKTSPTRTKNPSKNRKARNMEKNGDVTQRTSASPNSLHPYPMTSSMGGGLHRHDHGHEPKSRWKTLSSVFKRLRKNESECVVEKAKPFRFPAFNVIEIRPDIAPPNALDRLWLRVTSPRFNTDVDLKICTRLQSLKLQDLTGFNNTGNICVWPSEEVMAGYCMENLHLFQGKKVLELGAGMTGLAGLVVAQACAPQHVCITDGNEKSVENLDIILDENQKQGLIENVSSKLVRWANGTKDLDDAMFDIIICADCLFFDEGRPQLLECLKKALCPGGISIIVAPSRSGTFEDFLTLACESECFANSEEIHQYSERICQVAEELEKDSRFIANLHCPRLIKLEKKKEK